MKFRNYIAIAALGAAAGCGSVYEDGKVTDYTGKLAVGNLTTQEVNDLTTTRNIHKMASLGLIGILALSAITINYNVYRRPSRK